jgi:3-oxocholest-4-en-26-oyl-CoA dehydrogenase alpha subunit
LCEGLEIRWVAMAQTMRDISPDPMDMLGIYGGTLEVFRNMIAQCMLGLGKPNYSPPLKKTS